MHQKRIKTWVDALRSGFFTQTKGKYYLGDCYCATGLAIRLFRDDLDASQAPGVFGEDVYTGTSELVRYYAGKAHVGDASSMFILVQRLNDTGQTFDQIADWVEKEHLVTVTEPKGAA